VINAPLGKLDVHSTVVLYSYYFSFIKKIVRSKSQSKSKRSQKSRLTRSRRRRTNRLRLRGGAGICVNNHTDEGLPIDPITLEAIPRTKYIKVAVTYDGWRHAKDTDYYCFNGSTLLEWLKTSTMNPLTGVKFSQYQGEDIALQVTTSLLRQGEPYPDGLITLLTSGTGGQ
jgi:hypothetical protein